jgi:hypothetical protein
MLYYHLYMKARSEDKKRAVILRKQGLSYKEIRELIPVSKGLLSIWFRGLELTSYEKEFLEGKQKERIRRGRILSLISNKTRRIEREKGLIGRAEEAFEKWKGDPMFHMGVNLFWAHGAKKAGYFQFTSSDPDAVFLMFAWIGKYLGLPKERIKLVINAHASANIESLKSFWIKNLDIKPQDVVFTPYRTEPKQINRDPFYKGSVRLILMGIGNVRLMKTWQKLSIEYYGKALIGGKPPHTLPW